MSFEKVEDVKDYARDLLENNLKGDKVAIELRLKCIDSLYDIAYEIGVNEGLGEAKNIFQAK